VEILKFDDSEKSLPSKKPSGRGAILVGFIALVFGAGTALASGSLTINSGNDIILDQGVVAANTCDSDGDVNLDLLTSLYIDEGEEKFVLTGVTLTGLSGDNCAGKTVKIKVYGTDGSLQPFCKGTDSGCNTGEFYMTKPYNAESLGEFTFSFNNELSTEFVKYVTVETVD
jgi:hypothetical protein